MSTQIAGGETTPIGTHESASTKKMIVINCENSTAWTPIDFVDMFRDSLAREGTAWDSINVANGDTIPENIDSYHGVVLTGSRFNVCDRDKIPWFNPLADMIVEAEKRGTPRIFGGCFGCQIIAVALGGVVSRNPGEVFALKAENVTAIEPHFSTILPASKQLTYNLIVSHGYCICELPPCATCLASSPSCCNEMYLAGQHSNILACQSHPEFHYDYAIRDRIWKAVVDKFQRLSDDAVEEARASFEAFDRADSDALCSLIADFLCE